MRNTLSVGAKSLLQGVARCAVTFLLAAIVFAAVGAPLPPRAAQDGLLGMKFVPLAKGTFYMGWDGQKKGWKTEIKQEYEMAIHTVTQGQWRALMNNNPSYFSRDGGGKKAVENISDAELAQFPIENVSWDDAQAFIEKLNKNERNSGWSYRLPTEEEWEYACRCAATSEANCSFCVYFDRPSNDLSSIQANFDGNYPLGKAAKGKYLERPAKVGSYPPNRLGLYDMHGNVWQWCQSVVAEDGRTYRVIRGGGWLGKGSQCQAGSRRLVEPSKESAALGFRLIRVPSPRE